MNTKQKKTLYESIMKSVAKTVKQSIDEAMDFSKIKNAANGASSTERIIKSAQYKHYRELINQVVDYKPFQYIEKYGWYQGFDPVSETLFFEVGRIDIQLNSSYSISEFDDYGEISVYGIPSRKITEQIERIFTVKRISERSYQQLINQINNSNVYYVPTAAEYNKFKIPKTILTIEHLEFLVRELITLPIQLDSINTLYLFADKLFTSSKNARDLTANADTDFVELSQTDLNNQSLLDMLSNYEDKFKYEPTSNSMITIPVFKKICVKNNIEKLEKFLAAKCIKFNPSK